MMCERGKRGRREGKRNKGRGEEEEGEEEEEKEEEEKEEEETRAVLLCVSACVENESISTRGTDVWCVRL